MTTAPAGSRTARAKADRQARIFAAASELFQRHGFDGVTTQMIADAADVGAGTVFLHYPTKASLFVAVMRTTLAEGVDTARRLAGDGASALEAILAEIEPLLLMTEQHPQNTATFQREVLFGPAAGASADPGRDIIDAEHAIADVLALTHPHLDDQRRSDMAHVIYATVYLDLIRASRPAPDGQEAVREVIHRHVAMLLDSIAPA